MGTRLMALRVWAREIVEDIRDSYWFLPGLLAFAGFAAGLAMIILDFRIGDQWLGRYEWLYGSRPDGARQILATIAGSTITVAGVVFSITLAAVTYASGQYGPRLLSNFIRDRGNQATLGVFVGTFLYCLIVLRTIRSAEEASADTGGAVREAFVPHAAMFGALALAVSSISVLIYFVHHVTYGIHINNVIAKIGRQLITDIRARHGDQSADIEGLPVPILDELTPISAGKTGYIEAIDVGVLLDIACRHDLVLRLVRRAGDFVHRDRPMIELWPASTVDPSIVKACNAAFAVGGQRTSQQDLRFGVDELVEIAARALSPGVNDPFTAIACIDWLGAAISELGCMPRPSGVAGQSDGKVRVLACPLRFGDYLASAFGQLRPYAAADLNARRHAAATLEEVGAGIRDNAYREMVSAERLALLRCANQ